MELSKHTRAVIALAVAILLQIPELLNFKITNLINVILIAPITYFFVYYFLGVFHSKEKRKPAYPLSIAKLWFFAYVLSSFTFFLGVILFFIYRTLIIFHLGIILGLLAFSGTVFYHTYHTKRLSQTGSTILFVAYVLLGISLFTLQISTAIKFILFIVFSVASLINIYYSLYIGSAYAYPKIIERALQIRAKRSQKKKK